jgi:hypothetical protein
MADSPECKKDKRADSLGSLDPEDWVVNPEPLEGQVPGEGVAQVSEVLSQMKRTDSLDAQVNREAMGRQVSVARLGSTSYMY